jgi:hypothetical protein
LKQRVFLMTEMVEVVMFKGRLMRRKGLARSFLFLYMTFFLFILLDSCE